MHVLDSGRSMFLELAERGIPYLIAELHIHFLGAAQLTMDERRHLADEIVMRLHRNVHQPFEELTLAAYESAPHSQARVLQDNECPAVNCFPF
jgi:hypothetical protein